MGLRDLMKISSPPWLTTGTAEKYLYSIGLVADAIVDKLNQAMEAWMPGRGTVTAYPYLGADRRIVRGAGEGDAGYASRLTKAFDSWRYSGGARGVLGQLRAFVTPDVSMIVSITDGGEWYAYDSVANTFGLGAETNTDNPPSHYTGAGFEWHWDAYHPARWSRFWIVWYAAHTPEGLWGTGTWGDGGVWGMDGVTPEAAIAWRGIIKSWKGAHAECLWILWVNDPAVVEPGGALPDVTWGKWGKVVSGVAVESRSGDVRFLSGV